jgi:hypothetical protein
VIADPRLPSDEHEIVLHNDGSWEPLPFKKDPRSLPPEEQAALARERLKVKQARKVETFCVEDDEEEHESRNVSPDEGGQRAQSGGSSSNSSSIATCDKESSEAAVLEAAAAAAAAEAVTKETRKRNVSSILNNLTHKGLICQHIYFRLIVSLWTPTATAPPKRGLLHRFYPASDHASQQKSK